MNLQEENIFGTRLKLARKMAGLSLQELADATKNKITKQALSKYEKGMMNPSGEIILAIAAAFKLKPDYFLKKKGVELGEVSFRKRVRLSKKIESSIVEKVRDYTERHLEIEQILNIKNDFDNPLKADIIRTIEDVEGAANKLKAYWNLGSNPIPNLVETLELKGIKIFLIEENDDFDGLAVMSSTGIPIVAINIKNRPIERIRFTIIHELAHILLNFDDAVVNTTKKVEIFCHYFSSSFLIPREILVKLIGSFRKYIKINELISVKEYYGLSIRAIVHRLEQIGVINKNYYTRWMVYMSKEYGAKVEPGNYKGKEEPSIFNQLVNRALAEELITISKAAALWNVSINEIRNGYSGK